MIKKFWRKEKNNPHLGVFDVLFIDICDVM